MKLRKSTIKYIFKISRPRFWHYLLGPFVIGFTLNSDKLVDYWDLFFILFFIFFTFPANFLIYSINDYFDREIDTFNNKKNGFEEKYEEKRSKIVIMILSLIIGFLIIIMPWLSLEQNLILILFLFLSNFYSAPPLRFKTKPFLDFSSNILYFIPGIFGYFLAGGEILNWLLILAFYFWTSAMHLFSAVPDIEPDKEAKITTTATFLGYKKSLILVSIFWLLFSIIIITQSAFHILSFITLIYPILSILSMKNQNKIFGIYKIFPIVNIIIGFGTFLYIFIVKVV